MLALFREMTACATGIHEGNSAMTLSCCMLVVFMARHEEEIKFTMEKLL
jgi:hypothetical protein